LGEDGGNQDQDAAEAKNPLLPYREEKGAVRAAALSIPFHSPPGRGERYAREGSLTQLADRARKPEKKEEPKKRSGVRKKALFAPSAPKEPPHCTTQERKKATSLIAPNVKNRNL